MYENHIGMVIRNMERDIKNMIDEIKDLKDQKKSLESEIEDIKTNIIKTKKSFYEQDKNYLQVVRKCEKLDELFDPQKEESINKIDIQLLNIIKKCFDKIVSKKIDLKMSIKNGDNREIKLGLNNKGIGELVETYSYYSNPNAERPTRTNQIDNLETYLNILKNPEIVNKIKSKVFKKEKKEMLDTLHEYLQEWTSEKSLSTDISVHRDIYVQRKSEYNQNWNVNFYKHLLQTIKIRISSDSVWRRESYVKQTALRIYLCTRDSSGSTYTKTAYSENKPSEYDRIDLQDQYYMMCQIWDILPKYIDDVIDKVENGLKVKMNILKSIWNNVSPYLLVDAI